jgi:hypothetical protein
MVIFLFLLLGAELPFFFHFLSKKYNYFTREEEQLSLRVMEIYSDFLKEKYNNLPIYDIENDMSIGFNNTIHRLSRHKKKFCDLWDKIGY